MTRRRREADLRQLRPLGLATVATAYTSSFARRAACRALQGVAMAATAPAGYALLGRAFLPINWRRVVALRGGRERGGL